MELELHQLPFQARPSLGTVKLLIKDTRKKDKPPNKGQAESTLVYKLCRKSPLKEDNLSTKDKTAGPRGVFIKRFHLIRGERSGRGRPGEQYKAASKKLVNKWANK